MPFENYSLSSPRYHPKIIDVLKNVKKTSASVLIKLHENKNETENKK